MKHRILLLLSCIFFLQGMLNAQDLEPGQQAQGYLDSKSMMVDYATGIFHYKIPLFTLGSGDFQLPISLNYSSKGVKYEDACGLIGYNWLLIQEVWLLERYAEELPMKLHFTGTCGRNGEVIKPRWSMIPSE